MQVVVANQTISGFAMYGNINEEVVATGGMNIRVGRLSGIVDGISFYFNTGIDILIETGGSSRRIDTIVIRKDQASRKVSVEVKKGDNTNTPQPLTQNFLGIYEIAICNVAVDANQTILQQNNITDRRAQFSYKLSRTGEIVAWAGNLETIPKNALLCDGREISRNYYMNVFNKLGVIWGAGTSTKFTYNDSRGSVGTYQGTAVRNITGYFDCGEVYVGTVGGAFYRQHRGYMGLNASDRDNYRTDFNASRVVPTGQTNRDNNLAVHWIIFI